MIPSRRDMVLTILQGNSRSIAQEIGETCAGQTDLQPIYFKPDRLLGRKGAPYALLTCVRR